MRKHERTLTLLSNLASYLSALPERRTQIRWGTPHCVVWNLPTKLVTLTPPLLVSHLLLRLSVFHQLAGVKKSVGKTTKNKQQQEKKKPKIRRNFLLPRNCGLRVPTPQFAHFPNVNANANTGNLRFVLICRFSMAASAIHCLSAFQRVRGKTFAFSHFPKMCKGICFHACVARIFYVYVLSDMISAFVPLCKSN